MYWNFNNFFGFSLLVDVVVTFDDGRRVGGGDVIVLAGVASIAVEIDVVTAAAAVGTRAPVPRPLRRIFALTGLLPVVRQ